MKILYRSSKGRELNFNESAIQFAGADIFNYEWKPVTNGRQYGSHVVQFNKNAKELNLSVCLKGADSERKDALNRIYETCEFDVMTQKNGRLYFMPDSTASADINYQYYVNCYLINAEVEELVQIGGVTNVKLVFYCYDALWFKESASIYFGKDSGTAQGEFLDFPHGYAYDYSRSMNAAGITNNSFIDTDFRLVIHGPAENPTIYINGHAYGLDYTLDSENQYITIDTTNKTIILNDNGYVSSVFDYRNRDSYIFDPIPTGANTASWNDTFTWEIQLIEKRSAPKWI